MSTNVSQEEAQAIQESLGGSQARASEVTERDFSRPHRLSSREVGEIQSLAGLALPDLETFLATNVAPECTLSLADVTESAPESVVTGIEAPLCVVRFLVSGQPGWLVWENRAAVAAAETLLGSKSSGEEARALTPVEGQVLGDLLVGITQHLLGTFGLEAADPRLVQDAESVGSWKDGAAGAEPYRVTIELQLAGPGGESTLSLFLPGFPACLPSTAAAAASGQESPEVHGQLRGVDVELSVLLGHGEVALAELLALEPGDVLPLDRRVGDPIAVCVEEKSIARGELGTHRGHVAVRVTSFEHPPLSEHPPRP